MSGPSSPRAAPAPPVYWRGAPAFAVVLVAVVIARLPEMLPVLSHLRLGIVGSLVVMLLLLLKSNGGTWRMLSRADSSRLVLAYVLWAAVTIPFALWPGLAFTTVRTLFPVTAMFVAIMLCRPTWANLDKVQYGLVISLAAFALLSLLRGQLIAGRLAPVGETYDQNDLATIMAVAFALAAGIATRSRGRRRLVATASAVVLVAAILGSASRGGALALAVGAVVFVAGQTRHRRTIYAGGLLLGAIVAWQASGSVFRDRVKSLGDLEGDYNLQAKTGRIEVWKRSLHYMGEHPVAGVGAGNFMVAEGEYLEEQGESGKWSAAHNAYIQVFADLGIIGGIIFLVLVGGTLREAARLWTPRLARHTRRLHRPELLAALIAFCVGAIYLSLAYSGILFGLIALVGLAVRAARIERRSVMGVAAGAD